MAGLQWGNVPVPNTASWTAEVGLSLGRCPYFADAGIPALIQPCAQGQGKPLFGTPHSNRQREAMARCLCDICGKSLKASTKVSLSHARPYPHGAEGWRSEEHTSELQSLMRTSYAVFCLKKKKIRP